MQIKVWPAVLAALILLAPIHLSSEEAQLTETSESLLLSNVHLWKGYQYLQQGKVELATDSFLEASRYMRASPEPHFALSRVYLRTSVIDSFLEFTTGLSLLITDFFYQSMLVSNIVVVLLIAGTISMYAAIWVIVLRHSRTVLLSMLITFSRLMSEKYLRILIVACVFCLITLLSGRSLIGVVTWLALVGCGLSWRFADSSERRTIVSFAIFLILFGFLLNGVAQVASTQHPESPLRLAALAGRINQGDLERKLNKGDHSSRYDPINEFMQGLFHLRAGNHALAIEHLNMASKFAPKNAAILNNLGVAFHNLGQFREAKAAFEKAIRFAPREAAVHYNYSQTLNALLQFDLAQEELAKASTLDFELTRSLVTTRETNTLIPMNLQTRVLWKLAMHPENQMIPIDYHPVESGWLGTAMLVILTAAAVVLVRRAKIPTRCDICGNSVQAHLARRRHKEVLCPDCHAIKQANANDHQRIERALEQRLGKLRTHRSVARIIAGLLAPGSPYHIVGQRLKGFMISLAVFSFLILAIGGGGAIKIVPQLRFGPRATWPTIAFAFIYGIYAWRATALAVRSSEED